jgi:hypothetical protein
MAPDRSERYVVWDGPDGLHIELRQAWQCVGCGMLTFMMFAVGVAYATTPFAGWGTWMGLCVFLGAVVAMCSLWAEDWWISPTELWYQNSFRMRERCIERPPGEPISLRIEVIPRHPGSDQVPEPYVVHLIGPDGAEVGFGMRFRRSSNVDRFVKMLGCAVSIDVDDRRPETERLDGWRKPPSVPSDDWLE